MYICMNLCTYVHMLTKKNTFCFPEDQEEIPYYYYAKIPINSKLHFSEKKNFIYNFSQIYKILSIFIKILPFQFQILKYFIIKNFFF